MTEPEHYVRRVRARPYGPREVLAGEVTAWFHGPFLVLTLTGGTALTVRADLDDAPIGADLAALFSAAGGGRPARLPCPGLLVGERALTDETPAMVHQVSVRPSIGGAVLTVDTSGLAADAVLSESDAGRLSEEVRRWATSR
jgi:hypothetical protein